jgi:hypothetical protein
LITCAGIGTTNLEPFSQAQPSVFSSEKALFTEHDHRFITYEAERLYKKIKVSVVNGILKLVLSVEVFATERRWRLPVGKSLFAVARKKRESPE